MAEAVLGKQSLDFHDAALRKNIYGRLHARTPNEQPIHQSDSEVQSCSVEVFGVSGHADTFVKAFFENEEISGAGPVQAISYDKQSKRMIVSFQNIEGRLTLINSCNTLHGIALALQELSTVLLS